MRFEFMVLYIDKAGKGGKSTIAGMTVERWGNVEAVLNALATEGWELASAGYYGAGFGPSPNTLIMRRSVPDR